MEIDGMYVIVVVLVVVFVILNDDVVVDDATISAARFGDQSRCTELCQPGRTLCDRVEMNPGKTMNAMATAGVCRYKNMFKMKEVHVVQCSHGETEPLILVWVAADQFRQHVILL
jgi:hypothetical protein